MKNNLYLQLLQGHKINKMGTNRLFFLDKADADIAAEMLTDWCRRMFMALPMEQQERIGTWERFRRHQYDVWGWGIQCRMWDKENERAIFKRV